MDVPSPKPIDGQINIRTKKSLVSIGTERMLIDFGEQDGLKGRVLSQIK